MKKQKINDVFFIEKRLKEIDRRYFLLFDKKKQTWEVHLKHQNPSLCVTIPYPVPDERTILLVNKTRVENMKKLMQEIDESNLKLEKKMQKEMVDSAMKSMEEILAKEGV